MQRRNTSTSLAKRDRILFSGSGRSAFSVASGPPFDGRSLLSQTGISWASGALSSWWIRPELRPVYVSQVLNPDASLADVLLDPRLAQEGPKFVPMLAHSLLTQLESTDDATTALYLSYRHGGEIPARMGYLIGYEIARRTAATRQITELARLQSAKRGSIDRLTGWIWRVGYYGSTEMLSSAFWSRTIPFLELAGNPGVRSEHAGKS